MVDLLESREKIDRIDKQIVDLFEERMRVAADVAEYKRNTGKQVLDRAREQSKLEVLQAMASNEFNAVSIRELFSQIMSMSRKLQYTLLAANVEETFEELPELAVEAGTKVVFFGVKGSYSEKAMLECFGEQVEGIPAATFQEVMEKIEQGEALYGVLPIENTTTGGITDIYDLLVEYGNCIVAEHVVKIDHALLAPMGANVSDIQEIYSHPQALMQCENFFKEHPEITKVPAESTAKAALYVAEMQDNTKAALAGAHVANLYGLSVLQEQVNTEAVNSTRFIVITKKRAYVKGANKISLCFELPHEAGTLYNILSHMIFNNLNMTKIESRPIAGKQFEYRFFVDFEGNLQDAGVKNALTGIRAEAMSLRILGNIHTS